MSFISVISWLALGYGSEIKRTANAHKARWDLTTSAMTTLS